MQPTDSGSEIVYPGSRIPSHGFPFGHFEKYHNTLCLSPQILHKHCFQFLLGLTMIPRENKQYACSNLEDKPRVLWPIPNSRVPPKWILDSNRNPWILDSGFYTLYPGFQSLTLSRFRIGLTVLLCPQRIWRKKP